MGKKLMIWKRKGLYNSDGWYRLRIPVKTIKKPIQLLLKGIVPPNNFITISNIKLVDNDGNEINCDMNVLKPVKFHFNNTERLTAFQQLHKNEIKPTTMILKERDSESDRSLIDNSIQTQNFYNGTFFTTPMTNSNPKMNGIRKLLSSNNEIEELLNNQSSFSSRIADDPTKQQQFKLNPIVPLQSFRQHGPIINQYTKSNTTVKHNIMKELNTLLSQIAGQPNLEMQLRQLAQRFRFTQINAEQGLKLLKNFMNLKGLQSKTAQLSASNDQEQNDEKLEPIKPINAPSYFIPVKVSTM
ncbi:unnamed protein product [Onchocerca flexuosa]|uniref:Uncharacterized protein n=1 Tax=Onchocerca flexuosa TaxID=387005 RepID=A0A183HDP0_9BILA|nr:unnamed protein product [Onchocerca flexuosa]